MKQPGISIWAPEEHRERVVQGAKASEIATIRQDVLRLLAREMYLDAITRLERGETVVLSSGALMLSPKESDGISMQPYPPTHIRA